jgi:hypothetical protein
MQRMKEHALLQGREWIDILHLWVLRLEMIQLSLLQTNYFLVRLALLN